MKKEFIIQSLINKLNAKVYLEIGVQRGKNFYKINAPVLIAVDPHFIIGYKRRFSNLKNFFNRKFYEMTSDNFFSKEAPNVFKERLIDIAFIDGLHTYEQSLQDFKNCLKYLSPNGIILFHDCNAQSKDSAAREFLDTTTLWNGDVWKTIVHIRSFYSELECFVLDCDHGVGVVRRKKPEAMLNYTEHDINKMTFEDFIQDRNHLLNLKKSEYLHDFIKTI
jgi:hypothetical protein